MSVPENKDTVDSAIEALEEVTDDISDVKVFDIPVLLIFLLLFLIVALQFFTRYVLNDSLGWTEEIARYFLILLGFIGSITCIRKGSHIYLEFFYRAIPTGTGKVLSVAVETVVAIFFGYLGVLGVELAQRTHAQRMVSIDLPKGIIYYTIVISCFLMALFGAHRAIKMARTPAAVVMAEKLNEQSDL